MDWNKKEFIIVIFQLGLENAVWKVQENEEWLELPGEKRVRIYADGLNLLSENINIIKYRIGMYCQTLWLSG
jgi:hypothetical protein